MRTATIIILELFALTVTVLGCLQESIDSILRALLIVVLLIGCAIALEVGGVRGEVSSARHEQNKALGWIAKWLKERAE